MHTYTYTHLHIYTHTLIHMYTHTHIHIYTYTHKHIYLYTSIRIISNNLKLGIWNSKAKFFPEMCERRKKPITLALNKWLIKLYLISSSAPQLMSQILWNSAYKRSLAGN